MTSRQQPNRHTWHEFNPNQILVFRHLSGKPGKIWKMGGGYCRALESFVFGGIRFYRIKFCDSVFGRIQTDQEYTVPYLQLEGTRRFISKNDGPAKKRHP